jgi:drug/metabolite transporter (DMT)-like permease
MTGIGIIGVFAMSGKIRLQFVNNRGLFIRGVLGGISTAIFFFSIKHIGLVKASFIACLYPVFSAIFAHFMLREKLTKMKTGAIIAAMSGVVMVMINGTGGIASFGTITLYDCIAVFGSILSGFTIVSIKKLQSTDSTIAIFFAQCLVGAFIVFIPANIDGGSVVTPGTMVLLLIIGLLATIGQILSTDSYRYITVANGSLLVLSAPVMNAITGYLLFHETITIKTLIGALVIVGSSSTMLIDKG